MNKLPVNKNKCVVMSFGLKFDAILWNYTINDFLLSRPEVVTDFGLVFDKKLSFVEHVQRTLKSSLKVYG